MKKARYIMPRAYFNHGYAQLLIYRRNHILIDIAKDYVSSDGFELGKWIDDMRHRLESGQLSEEQSNKLQVIGISPNEELQAWEYMYRKVYAYMQKCKELPPITYRTDDGVMVGAWIDKQIREKGTLDIYRQRQLERLGDL